LGTFTIPNAILGITSLSLTLAVFSVIKGDLEALVELNSMDVSALGHSVVSNA
ncbi:hypothetical protein BX616_010819, partial [Lobosporangium transversale]